MSFFHIFILALLQGLTEFLPVSSSAHLILPSQLLGWPDQGLAFDVAVHVGTLIAVMYYFRLDIFQIARGWLISIKDKQQNNHSILAWAVIVGTIPACIVGLFLGELIELYLRSIEVIALTTIGFGLLLLWADKRATQVKEIETLRIRDGIHIGLAQSIALIPGTSRSGITMSAALMKGFTRQASARFSFLLSIPLIIAAGSLKTKELVEAGNQTDWNVIGLGVVLSAISAYLCIRVFLALLDRVGMTPFVIYRLLLGALLLVVAYCL
jgi:undecaprenyl-diphosphatase